MLQPWNEIIEAQKIRSDLLKWKIIVVAALGATGLGLSTRRNIFLHSCCCSSLCIFLFVEYRWPFIIVYGMLYKREGCFCVFWYVEYTTD